MTSDSHPTSNDLSLPDQIRTEARKVDVMWEADTDAFRRGANEIERLTRELKRERALEEDISQFRVDGGEKLLAERDRLRAALEEIRGVKLLTDCGIHPMRAAGIRHAFEITAEIATKALSGEPSSAAETGERHYDGKDIAIFLGWLCVELPELHSIETPRLGRAWEKWRVLMDEPSEKAESNRE